MRAIELATTLNYDNAVQTNKKEKSETTTTQTVKKTCEEKLTTKAKDYLKTLREQYSDYDFYVADTKEEKEAALKQSDKEFSVVFTTEEIEKMAKDEKYAKEKMEAVKTAVEMSKRINEQFNENEDWKKANNVNKVAFYFDENGKITMFAELEKLSEKQKERIEEKKEEAKEDKKINNKNPFEKDEDVVKRVWLEATTEEELIEKIKNINWSKVQGVEPGAKLDISL